MQLALSRFEIDLFDRYAQTQVLHEARSSLSWLWRHNSLSTVSTLILNLGLADRGELHGYKYTGCELPITPRLCSFYRYLTDQTLAQRLGHRFRFRMHLQLLIDMTHVKCNRM